MILRNPTGRPVRLEIPVSGEDGDATLTLAIGAHASVDLDRYQRALDALRRISEPMPDMGTQDPEP